MVFMNPQLTCPNDPNTRHNVPDDWSMAIRKFDPLIHAELGNVWTGPDDNNVFEVEFGTAPFALSLMQPTVMQSGVYRMRLVFRPDITPNNLDGDETGYVDDFFYRLIVESGRPIYASDTLDSVGTRMDGMDTLWVNEYPSTGWQDESHKSQTLTLTRWITTTQENPAIIKFEVGSKWGRTGGKLYIFRAELVRVADAGEPAPTEPDGCLNQIMRLLGRLS